MIDIAQLGVIMLFIIRRETDKGSRGGACGESTRLPPVWLGFKSRCKRHKRVEFSVGFLLCSERFFSELSGFSLSSKTSIST